jgi:hypothetical protein
MASLAPGNGWFPAPAAKKQIARKRTAPTGNVYPFPPPSSGLGTKVLHAETPRVSEVEPLRWQRPGHLAIANFASTLVIGSLAWVTMLAAMVSALIVSGLAWPAVFVAAIAVHFIGTFAAAVLAVRMGPKFFGRSVRLRLLSQRNHLER